MRKDSFDWLDVTAEQAARRLLGCELVREIDGHKIRVRIVETEAYDQADSASHAFGGQTERNKAMFMSAGHLYVYFTYGMHYCINIVCGKEGFGSGALIRAVEPIEGYEIIKKNRGVAGVGATNGPAKLAQALRIDTALSGHDMSQPPLRLIKKPILPDNMVTVAKRIGISKAVHEMRRYYLTDNAYVSKK